jgi:uncharacterized protein
MILTDTGPLVALLDADDSHHAACVTAARSLSSGPLLTTWPCFTEAMYLLGEVGEYMYQATPWSLRSTGRVILLDLTREEIDRMVVLMEKYKDTPMDLADASLMAVAEGRSLRSVFSIDSDFFIYRLSDGTALEVVR